MNLDLLKRLKIDKGMIISYDQTYVRLGELYLLSNHYCSHTPHPFYVNKIGIAEFIHHELGIFDSSNREAMELHAQASRMKKKAVEKLLSEGYITNPTLFQTKEDLKSLKLKEKPKSFYVVYEGKKPGIYANWAECVAQVSKVSDSRYEKFPSLSEAEAALKLYKDLK